MRNESEPQTATLQYAQWTLRFTCWFVVLFSFPSGLFVVHTAQAEIRVVTAHGEHRMTDRETREDALRLATESARRNALEQVATYLESVTVVDGIDVTRDEIRTYTAGLVLVLDQQTNTILDHDDIVVIVELAAQVDTEEVIQAIAALKGNEEARHQLITLKQENDRLHEALVAANRALTLASAPEHARQAARERQEILNRVRSNAVVSQAWIDWALFAPSGDSSSWERLAQVSALLNIAKTLFPTSPHVTIAQQMILSTRQPPAPPRPPSPPSHGTSLQTMPVHEVVPYPGSQTPPTTLHELTHTTLTATPHIGNRINSQAQQPGTSSREQSVEQPEPMERTSNPTGSPIPPSTSPHNQSRRPPVVQQLPPVIHRNRPLQSQETSRTPSRIGSGGPDRAGAGSGGSGGRDGGQEQ